MTGFWLVASAMIVVALMLVLPPLLGRIPRDRYTREEANLAVYRERLVELKRELAAGTLDQSQYEEAHSELERAMLDDFAADKTPSRPYAIVNPLAAVVVGVAIPVLAFALYLSLGLPVSLVGKSSAPQLADDSERAAQPGLNELVARLETRLATHPEDPQGWWMLARTYATMNQLEGARRAFEEAYKDLDKEPALLVGYAEVLARINENRFAGKPAQLLSAALAIEPNSERALWLSGIAAFQEGKRAAAIAIWERLQGLGTLGPEETKLLSEFIARAEAQEPTPSAVTPPPPQLESEAASPGKLTVRVELSEAVAERVSPSDTVFVYARAIDGPRMPLAIVRTVARDLPATLTLDDSMAMSPQFKLSRYSAVVVEARVSKSSNAQRHTGDLEGLSEAVRPGMIDPVRISIRQVVP